VIWLPAVEIGIALCGLIYVIIACVRDRADRRAGRREPDTTPMGIIHTDMKE
jgi:hypothetical protein